MNNTTGMTMSDIQLFAGNANPELAAKIAKYLGLPLSEAVVSRFSDGETMVDILENVRGREVFIVQPTCAPANEHLMELMIMVDAARRASAGSITAVIPYFGYGRQDRRVRSARVPITAKVVADMLTGAGVDRIITVDLHADQIQGFFSIPVDNVYGTPVMVEDIHMKNYDNLTVVSPDVGGVVRARAVAKLLDDADLAIIDKRRPEPNHAEVMNIIGNVEGRTCIIVDDIVDTAGTLAAAANKLKEQGAEKVIAYCVHAVLSGKAKDNLDNSALDELVVSDTIPLSDAMLKNPKIRQLTLNRVLAETINRVSLKQSVSSMFSESKSK